MADFAAKTTTSIRLMPKNPDHTLRGYVFTDETHARQWLGQAFVVAGDYDLEVVEVGERRECRMCGGSGHTQKITPVRRLTVEEFLNGSV